MFNVSKVDARGAIRADLNLVATPKFDISVVRLRYCEGGSSAVMLGFCEELLIGDDGAVVPRSSCTTMFTNGLYANTFGSIAQIPEVA